MLFFKKIKGQVKYLCLILSLFLDRAWLQPNGSIRSDIDHCYRCRKYVIGISRPVENLIDQLTG